jgi:hypothetical protein
VVDDTITLKDLAEQNTQPNDIISKQNTKILELEQDNSKLSSEAAAFWSLKNALCTAPILGYTPPDEKFITNTDTDSIRIGEVLSQVQDGQE